MAGHVSASHGPPASGTLLERDAELAALRELLEAAARGHGGLVLVEGPPGVGKSALLERAAGMARERGLAVLRARGHELERAFGWGVARSLLEARLAGVRRREREELLAGPAAPARVAVRRAPSAHAAAPAAEAGFAILHALYWLAVRLAERAPLLLVVDDAQWADEPSLRFLVYLLGRLPDQPIAVLVGARAGEPGRGRAARAAARRSRGRRARAGAARARRRSPSCVRERLPGADDGFCRRCFELTGGNPLQLRELLGGDRAAGAAGRRRGARRRRPSVAARSLARSVLRRLGALSARRAGAGARRSPCFEDDAPLHAGRRAGGARAGRGAGGRGRARARRRAARPATRSASPIRWCAPRSTAQLAFGERAQTHRRRRRGCWRKPARRASG